MIKYLENSNDFNKEIESNVLVDFYADWCGPCKMMGRILEDVDYDILKVNVDKYSDIARTYGIMSIPTLILFSKKKEIKKNIGFISKEELEEFIK